jgi:hypothetical protein
MNYIYDCVLQNIFNMSVKKIQLTSIKNSNNYNVKLVVNIFGIQLSIGVVASS